MNRLRSSEEIRDYWLKNRGALGDDWEQAICAVYDLGWSDSRTALKDVLDVMVKQRADISRN